MKLTRCGHAARRARPASLINQFNSAKVLLHLQAAKSFLVKAVPTEQSSHQGKSQRNRCERVQRGRAGQGGCDLRNGAPSGKQNPVKRTHPNPKANSEASSSINCSGGNFLESRLPPMAGCLTALSGPLVLESDTMPRTRHSWPSPRPAPTITTELGNPYDSRQQDFSLRDPRKVGRGRHGCRL